MKLINRLFAVILVSAGLTITSCEFTELDLLDSPNSPTPDQAELEFLYNNIQLSFNGFYQGTLTAGRYARIAHMGNFTYNNSAPSTLGNGLWSSFYAGLLPDIQALIAIADVAGADIEKGSAKIMQAYAMTFLVMFLLPKLDREQILSLHLQILQKVFIQLQSHYWTRLSLT